MAFYHIGKRCEGVTVASRYPNIQMSNRYGGLLACSGSCEESLSKERVR